MEVITPVLTSEKIKRPTIDDAMLLEIAKKVSLDVKEWLEAEEDILDEIVADLLDVFEDELHYDAYSLCRKLESDHGYDPDEKLVDIMGQVDYFLIKLKNKKIREWVTENDITPKFGLGDLVEVTVNEKKYKGEIIRINSYEAQYTICIPELGHVGYHSEKSVTKGTLGIVKNFEDIDQ